MKIGIDIMGGDYSPIETVKGSILAAKEVAGSCVVVAIGKKNEIHRICSENKLDCDCLEIVDASQVIEMGDNPVKSFSQKPDSSMGVGFKMLDKGLIDGFASAGNTGAMLVGAINSVKTIPGIIRPVITAVLPTTYGRPKVLLDVGLNADCKPDVLYQYAVLGSIFAESVHGINNPKVGLLNIGSEEEKGNLLTKSTFQLMKGTTDFNFVGNAEGYDLFKDDFDVIVCDGFVGNVVLKEAEAFYELIKSRNVNDDFFDSFNFEIYGGTPVLGINKPVIIGHGSSKETAIKNMILLAKEVHEAGLTEKIKKALA